MQVTPPTRDGHGWRPAGRGSRILRRRRCNRIPCAGTRRTDLLALGTLTFRGYPLLYRKALAKRLNADGPLGADDVRAVAERVAAGFPPA